MKEKTDSDSRPKWGASVIEWLPDLQYWLLPAQSQVRGTDPQEISQDVVWTSAKGC